MGISSFESTPSVTGGEYKKMLRFVLCADNEPQVGHEISEHAIFRFLLNEETMGKFDEADEVEIAKMLDVLKDIDKQSKITQVEVYRSSMGKATDKVKAFHVFIIFKSTSETADDGVYWWSLEKNSKYIVLQRSRNKENVKDNLEGKPRTRVKLIEKDLKGKGTIKYLFAILWADQVIDEKYHLWKSNCQSLVTFVGEQITEIGYKYKGNFPYSPPRESGRDKQMLELINVIRGCSYWSLLFHVIKMGDTDLVDKTVASGKYDINASCNGLTPLHFAILLKKTEMVKHLLKPPLNADPTKRDEFGRSALLLAADKYEMNAEIIDLLLAHDKVNVDDVGEYGQTALHLAAKESNVKFFQKLLERGANPNILDKWGLSPLHLAVEKNHNEIIDLIFAHSKVMIDDVNEDGHTALHLAASVSNIVAVQKLLEKGANPNILDKEGMSPLHVAALYGREAEIFDLLVAHGKVSVDHVDGNGQTALHLAARNVNIGAVQKLLERGANPNITNKWGQSPLHVAARQRNGKTIIDLLLEAQKVKGMGDVNDQNEKGMTALHYAAAYSNEITAVHLINKGADVNCRDNNGCTPLHYAALGAKTMQIIDLLLENISEGDIQQYRNDKRRLFLFARHNKHGLGDTILDRLVEKNIKPPCSTETDDCITAESDDEVNDVNTHRFVLDKGADPSIDLTGFDGLDFLIARVKISLGIYDNINGRDQNGETLLFFAIRDINVIAVRRLLENGADPTIRNEYGLTPFHVATFSVREHTDPGRPILILISLLESGKVDIDETTETTCTFEHGMTALHLAVSNSNTALAEFLLSKGANPNVADKDGDTPLHLAVKYAARNMDIAKLLLNHPDVDVNCLNNWGHSALGYAIGLGEIWEHGKLIANLMIEKGAVETEKIRETRNKHRSRSIYNFIYRSKAEDETENVLSDATVPIEEKIAIMKNEQLISAITDSDVKSVRLLLENGADISSARGEYGNNALYVASSYAKTTELIDAILETGKLDINGVDNRGWTPLHWAIWENIVT